MRLWGTLAVLLSWGNPLAAQGTGIASLQTPAATSHSTFSIVPIGGVQAQITNRLSLGAYGLYSTDPQVSILCLAAPVKLNRFFAINPIYEYISPPKGSSGVRQSEHQMNIALDAGFTWRKWRLDQRNRIGRRFVHAAPDSTRYRQLFSAAYLLPGPSGLSVFHWQEFFYEGSSSRWEQHHIAAGFQKSLSSSLTGQLYYFRLAAHPRGDIHALGLTLLYNYRPTKHKGKARI